MCMLSCTVKIDSGLTRCQRHSFMLLSFSRVSDNYQCGCSSWHQQTRCVRSRPAQTGKI